MVSHSSLRPESVTNTPEHLVARTRGQFTACIRPAPSPSQVKSSSSKQTRSFLAFRPPGLSPDISDSLLLGRSGASRQPCAVAQSPPSLGSAFKDQPQRERARERYTLSPPESAASLQISITGWGDCHAGPHAAAQRARRMGACSHRMRWWWKWGVCVQYGARRGPRCICRCGSGYGATRVWAVVVGGGHVWLFRA